MISSLDVSFGSGISILRSSRPGRRSAGSRMSGRLVAITIFTCPRSSKPSSWFSSSINVRWISLRYEDVIACHDPPWKTLSISIRIICDICNTVHLLLRTSSQTFHLSTQNDVFHLSADVPSEKRLPPIASISSMKITHGWWSCKANEPTRHFTSRHDERDTTAQEDI